MANTIDFNVSTNAVNVLNQTGAAAENTAKGFTSAKAELRALQQQLLTMDQSSAEFKKASARAAELKDNISDLSAEISANAGNAFEGLSNNVGLFGSRLMDLDLKGAGQALSGMGAAVKKIDFKTVKDEIGGLVQGFGTLAKAIISNPILLLAGAVALVVANFDDLIKLFPAVENGLTGIDEQQREIAKNAQATADASKKAYENSSLQENSLRLQGKSEKEILQIKMKKLETSIKDAKVNLEIQEKQAESQIAASKRNAELLQQIVRGALELSAVGLRMLVAPIDLVLKTANEVSKALGFGEITAINLNDEITKLTEAGSKLVTELLIDPAKQEKELKESFDKQRHEIDQMTSDYQGFQLAIQKMDKDAADKAKAEREKTQEEIKKDLEEKKKLYKEIRDAEIAAEDAKYKALQAIQETAQEKEITAAIEASEALYALAGDDAAAQALIAENLAKQIAAINKKYKDAAAEDAEKEKADRDKQNEANAIEAAKELEKLKKAEEAKAQLRVDTMKTSLSIIGDLAQAFAGDSERQQRKAFQIQKGVSIATATIDTYLAAQGAYRSQMAISTPDAPVRAAVAAGIAIAQGLARVAIISKQQFQGSGGTSGASGGGSLPSSNGGTQAPSPANFAFLQNQPNQQPPLQAYVVSGQVSSNLEAQQLINNQARLGG